ncbi:MAG: hypothetical protein KIS91_06260 [Anaerolineae bacterium]|nr:hypothetical protein [Anaerolineae bacterium]
MTVIDDRPPLPTARVSRRRRALIVDYFRPALAALPLDRQSYVIARHPRPPSTTWTSLLTILGRSTGLHRHDWQRATGARRL